MNVLSILMLPAPGLAATPARLEWTIVDVAEQRTYTVPDSAAKLADGGQLEAAPDGSQLKLSAQYVPAENGTAINVHLADQSDRDRGLVVRLGLALPTGEWRWFQDLDTASALADNPQSNTVGLRGLPGLPYFDEAERPEYGTYSVYPLGVVEREGEWLALARAMSELALARFIAQGGDEPRLSAEVDLALSEYTDPPRTAAFTLWFLSGEADGDAAMRAALEGYYRMKPDDWEVRVPIFGGWMPFTSLAALPNVDEFGFAYQEGGRDPAFHDTLGALSFIYFHCAGEFANVSGYERGTEPLPPYEDVVAAFNAVAKQRTGIENVWDLCGIQDPDGKIAYRPERTYGDFFCQACVDPDLPYGKAMVENLVGRVTEKASPEGIDGAYYDGIAAGLDYAPEHLKVANHVLLWDGKLGRPLNYNLWSSAEWAEEIHRRFAGTGKLTMLNDSSLSSFAFVGPYIDVPGGEMSILLQRNQARLIRALTGRKPFCTLVKADFSQIGQAQIETYMRRCVAYGILFGFFDITPSGAHPGSSYWLHPEWYDRDRALFRRYMPIARELARTGWQPVPQVEIEGEGAYVEEFRRPDGEGLRYFVVSTDPGEDPEQKRPVTLKLNWTELLGYFDGPPGLAVELLTGRTERESDLTTEMTGDDLAVWAVSDYGGQRQASVARLKDVLQRREQYREVMRRTEAHLEGWSAYGAGAKLAVPGRDSRYCLEASRNRGGEAAGANQTIVVNHDRPRELIVSAWSKAEVVAGEPSNDYSLYVDCYYTDGSAIYGQTVPFRAGTHDWEYGEREIKPGKPIRNINVYLLLRGAHTGLAWFDDVKVALKDDPEKNLLERGDFEPDQPMSQLAQDSPEALQLDNTFRELAALVAAGDVGPGAVQQAEAMVDEIERIAREANWGADTERTLRDVEDMRWHLRLARACLRLESQPAQRPSRLTEFGALSRPRVSTGPKQYKATTGKLPPGTIVAVDSNYSGYGPEPMTDGKINPASEDWTKVAWASGEHDGPHWIELRFPSPTKVREVRIWWASDTGKLHASRQVEAQVQKDGDWVPIDGQEVKAGDEPGLTVIRLPGGSLKALRILQSPHCGSADRPDLMWVTEVEVTAG